MKPDVSHLVNWVTELVAQFYTGKIPLKVLVSSLEDVVDELEKYNPDTSKPLVQCWFDMEILNALNLDSGQSVSPEEIDELLNEFLSILKEYEI